MTDTAQFQPLPPPARQISGQVEKAILSQQSLVWGILISLALAFVVDMLVGNLLLGIIFLDDLRFTHGVFVLALASLYYVWGLHEIPIGWRGPMLIFGTRRLRQSGKGLSEGWQWVPRPLMSIKNVDTRDTKMILDDSEGAYTKDGALMSLKGFLRYQVVDPYIYIALVDVEDSLKGLALQAMRIQVKLLTALELRGADKAEFSQKVEDSLERQLMENGNPKAIHWGIDPGMLVIEDIWATRDELETAWNASATEDAEGRSEKIQTDRRAEQTQKYIDMGVSPDIAVVAAQTDVGKAGAKLSGVSFGKGIEKGIAAIVESLTRK